MNKFNKQEAIAYLTAQGFEGMKEFGSGPLDSYPLDLQNRPMDRRRHQAPT